MNVAAIVNLYPPRCMAGAELYLHGVLRWLGKGDTCTVYTSDAGPGRLDGVKLVNVRDMPRHLPGVDVIMSQIDWRHRATQMARRTGLPLVLFGHGDRQFGMACELMVTNSHHLAVVGRRWHDEVWVLPPPIWPGDYQTADSVDRHYVTMVNLCRAKGVDTFYALARLFPQTPFLGVTGGYDQQIPPPADVTNVTVLPHPQTVAQMAARYAASRVVLVPSQHESYGRVAIEACCAGVPVLASNVPGLAESLDGAGVLLPVPGIGDDTANRLDWYAALTMVLAHNRPDVYNAASEAAIARADRLDPDGDLELFARRLEQVR